ncbi:beta-microseminoprotein A1-like [Clarias gariepinus]|uniref:beta-microseminoprotein A1-like n=1 Tax=Clarias gariepinus TaxID=13013 RepID=UPI00234CD583|nr:beta-microseminoprotein A1-like [Clarias gariepinus]
MLKSLVFVGFPLFALFHMSHAACWIKIVEPDATHCQDDVDNTQHRFGSKWKNSRCDECSCTSKALRCCNGWPTGTSGDCIIKHDYKTCTFKVIDQKNPHAPCGLVGK